MTFNITSPNSAQFVVQFTDADGIAVSPTSAALTINYFVQGVANSTTMDLSASGSFWTATWSSVAADVPSDATWSVISSVSSVAAQTGTLRIIDP